MKSKLVYVVAALSLFAFGATVHAAPKVSACGISFNKPSFAKIEVQNTADSIVGECMVALSKNWSMKVFKKQAIATAKLDEKAAEEVPGYEDTFQKNKSLFDNYKKYLKTKKLKDLPDFFGGLGGPDKTIKTLKKGGAITGVVYTTHHAFDFPDFSGFDLNVIAQKGDSFVLITRDLDLSNDTAILKEAKKYETSEGLTLWDLTEKRYDTLVDAAINRILNGKKFKRELKEIEVLIQSF